MKTKLKYIEAAAIAITMRDAIQGLCNRVEIAGSLRRHRPEIGDIELVIEPKPLPPDVELFNRLAPESPERDAAISLAPALFELQRLGARLVSGGSRLKKLYMPDYGIQVELYIVLPPAQWGVLFTIRTGSANFSHWAVTPRKYGGGLPSYLSVSNGAVHNSKGEIIPTPDEADFLRILELEYLPANGGARDAENWHDFKYTKLKALCINAAPGFNTGGTASNPPAPKTTKLPNHGGTSNE